MFEEYLQHILALAIAGVLMYKNRDYRPALLVFAYCLMYTALEHFLIYVGLFEKIPYLGLAIAIDWIFLYFFIGLSWINVAALISSILAGSLTFFSVLAGGTWLYATAYDPFMLIIAGILLVGSAWDGRHRAFDNHVRDWVRC